MSVKQLLETTDSRELSEAEAVDKLEPIDSTRRIELALGIVAATIANAHRSKDQDPFQPSDFIQEWGKTYRDESAASIAATESEIEARERDIAEKRKNIVSKFCSIVESQGK